MPLTATWKWPLSSSVTVSKLLAKSLSPHAVDNRHVVPTSAIASRRTIHLFGCAQTVCSGAQRAAQDVAVRGLLRIDRATARHAQPVQIL